jgi:hypothetical protein
MRGFARSGRFVISCDPERSEGSAFLRMLGAKADSHSFQKTNGVRNSVFSSFSADPLAMLMLLFLDKNGPNRLPRPH